MNKRIDNLFGQALDESISETWTTLNPTQLTKLKEKFAELIVQECGNFTDPITRNLMFKHFGVEE